MVCTPALNALSAVTFLSTKTIYLYKLVMVAYICHHFPVKYVDLSDLYVDLSDLYDDLSLIHLLEDES